jgi:histidinol-phosphatase (PHP family)
LIPFNLHTHSIFCDGSDHPEKYVMRAIDKGFHTLGFSSHAPVPFTNHFAIQSNEKLLEYTETIRELQRTHREKINIFLGLEIDYITGLMPEFRVFNEICGLDFAIGSVHLVKKEGEEKLWFIDGPRPEIYEQGLDETFGGDIRRAVTNYWHQLNRMIAEEDLDIVGHLDKVKMHNRERFFSERDAWYRKLVFETLDLIKERGLIVEINTRGLYKGRARDYFPGVWIIRELMKMKIPATVCSDAHKPEEMNGHYSETERTLKELGIRELMVLTPEGWSAVAL